MSRLKYKTLIIIPLVTVGLISLSYCLYLKNLKLKFLLLESICLNLSDKSSKEETDVKFKNFFSKELQINKEGYQEKFYGISQSEFDSFCIVSFDKNEKVYKSGLSYH